MSRKKTYTPEELAQFERNVAENRRRESMRDECLELYRQGVPASELSRRFPEFTPGYIYSFAGRAGVKRTFAARQVYIYALRCPLSKQYFYVGCSADPWKRYYGHLSWPGSAHLKQWMKSLKKLKLRPELAILDYQESADAAALEREWILRIEAEGHPLMNKHNRRDTVWQIRSSQHATQPQNSESPSGTCGSSSRTAS